MPLLLERSATLLRDLRVAALAERENLKPKQGRKTCVSQTCIQNTIRKNLIFELK
jgi:hypothetical protein